MTDVDMSEPVSGEGAVTERSLNSSSSRKPSTTISTRSSRRTASPSRVQQQAASSKQDSDAGPPTPESPPFRLTRKRAASLAADKGDAGRDEADVVNDDALTPTTHSRMSSGGASAGSVGSAASHVCLCQPDPKIPRPRNAFILYRQHHQAAIVAQNPGLANPDISKIIGEQWKHSPESVRIEWKALAEEEKLRHQQQYPDYRYQPRRGGRRGSLSSINTTSGKHHCNKCGGRSITTPTTPFSSHHHSNYPTTAASSAPMLPPPTPSSALTPTSRYLPPMMSNLAINTAQAQAAQQQQAAARPRGNGNGATRPTPTPLTSLHVARSREDALDLQMLSPLSPDVKRRRFNQQTYVPPSSGNRQPPPPPGTPYPFAGDPRRQSLPRPDILRGPSSRHGSHDAHSSLTLPPLQTGVATATPAAGGGSPLVNGGADPQGRSVEAVVMGMPFWGKIRVLGKIAPPWRPAAREPAAAVRGAIVAVEGDDGAAVVGMSRWLEENLNKTGETHARVAEAPRAPPQPLRRSPGGEGSGGGTSLGEYIDVIAEWHGRTREMVEFITRAPGEEGTPTPTERMVGEGGGEVRTPVLIMPTYNLGAADAWASRISITDNYSPADHWQWVATLWRGIVGPDITIYIRDVQAGELEMTGGKAVEVREDGQTKCLIVKRAVAKDIDESAMRRLGFEVGELIRGVSGLNGK